MNPQRMGAQQRMGQQQQPGSARGGSQSQYKINPSARNPQAAQVSFVYVA